MSKFEAPVELDDEAAEEIAGGGKRSKHKYKGDKSGGGSNESNNNGRISVRVDAIFNSARSALSELTRQR